MDGCGSPAGIPHFVPSPPTCVTGTPGAIVLCSGFGLGESPAGRGLQDAPEGCGGTHGPARSRVLQSAVPRREGDRELKARHRFVDVERIHHSDEVPNGDLHLFLSRYGRRTGCSPSP